jgi:hypothetical protein
MLEQTSRSHYGSKSVAVTITAFKYRNKIGDYTNMNTFLQCDWNDILKGKNAGKQFDIFMTKFNEAKNIYIPFLDFSSDIPVLVFLLELAYFQKILGLLLAFFAISFSILAFAFLIALLT